MLARFGRSISSSRKHRERSNSTIAVRTVKKGTQDRAAGSTAQRLADSGLGTRAHFLSWLGILPEEEHLHWIATDAAKARVPDEWLVVRTTDGHYYYNERTQQTHWEHPSLPQYIQILERHRSGDTAFLLVSNIALDADDEDVEAHIAQAVGIDTWERCVRQIDIFVEDDGVRSALLRFSDAHARDSSLLLGHIVIGAPYCHLCPVSPVNDVQQAIRMEDLSRASRCVRISNLPASCSEEELKTLCEMAGSEVLGTHRERASSDEAEPPDKAWKALVEFAASAAPRR